MKAVKYIQLKQQIWADKQGFKLIGSKGTRGEKNYTINLNDNLFLPLEPNVKQSFIEADGRELNKKNNTQPKMKALHSSSALAVNVFQYWLNKDIAKIAILCGLARNKNLISKNIVFEKKYVISNKFKRHPNIDVVIENSSENRIKVFAIESKFSEAYDSRNHKGLKKKYLPLRNIWEDIPNTFELAKKISPNDNIFSILEPAQLIRHILGLKNKYGKPGFRLLYLWYDTIDEEGYIHKKEIKQFSDIVKKDGLNFHSLSYQELIYRLRKKYLDEHYEYIQYLSDRYL